MNVGELIEALSKLDPRLPVKSYDAYEVTEVDVDLDAISDEPRVSLS